MVHSRKACKKFSINVLQVTQIEVFVTLETDVLLSGQTSANVSSRPKSITMGVVFDVACTPKVMPAITKRIPHVAVDRPIVFLVTDSVRRSVHPSVRWSILNARVDK